MEDKELTFWEHLDVLRWALVRIVVVWFILAIGFFIAMPNMFDTVILGPCHDNFIFYQFLRKIGEALHLTGDFFTQQYDIKLQNINLAAPFFVHLSTSFVLSLVVLAPYILWEIWMFIRPALYANESRGVKKALLLGSVMFYLGVAVGYFMIYPMTLRFLSTYNLSPDIEILISLNSYIDNFMTLILCMGLAFELPLVTWILSLLGIITRDTLREYRRHAFVVIVIVGAIITPTGDPFTLMAVSLPLYALYELSILMIKEKKDDEDDEKPDGDGGNNGGGQKPSGGAPAQKVLAKKPDDPKDGGAAKAQPATADSNKAEDKKTDGKDSKTDGGKSISQVLNEQRAAAQRAKTEASNKALQERLDAVSKTTAAGTAAAAATGATDATAATTDAPALTANTETPVKEALATAAAATAKKAKEPHMVIIGDEIFYETYPDEEDYAAQTTADSQTDNNADAADTHTAEPTEEKATTEQTAATEQPAEEPIAADNTPSTSAQPAEAEPTTPADKPQQSTAADVAEPEAPTAEGPANVQPSTEAQPDNAEPATVQKQDEAQTEAAKPAETQPVTNKKPAKPRIDLGGIKYDPSRFNQ